MYTSLWSSWEVCVFLHFSKCIWEGRVFRGGVGIQGVGMYRGGRFSSPPTRPDTWDMGYYGIQSTSASYWNAVLFILLDRSYVICSQWVYVTKITIHMRLRFSVTNVCGHFPCLSAVTLFLAYLMAERRGEHCSWPPPPPPPVHYSNYCFYGLFTVAWTCIWLMLHQNLRPTWTVILCRACTIDVIFIRNEWWYYYYIMRCCAQLQ